METTCQGFNDSFGHCATPKTYEYLMLGRPLVVEAQKQYLPPFKRGTRVRFLGNGDIFLHGHTGTVISSCRATSVVKWDPTPFEDHKDVAHQIEVDNRELVPVIYPIGEILMDGPNCPKYVPNYLKPTLVVKNPIPIAPIAEALHDVTKQVIRQFNETIEAKLKEAAAKHGFTLADLIARGAKLLKADGYVEFIVYNDAEDRQKLGELLDRSKFITLLSYKLNPTL